MRSRPGEGHREAPVAVRLGGQQVLIGDGSAEELPRLVAGLGVRQPLIVTTRSAAGPELVGTLRSFGWEGLPRVFATAHAPIADVREAAEAYRAAGADGLVAIGGGSAIDTAKLVALDAMSGGTALDALERTGEQFVRLPGNGREGRPATPPVLAVPTTASQAEFTTLAGITVPGHGKIVVNHPAVRPAAVVLDAGIVRRTPTRLWVATAVKAIDSGVLTLAGLPSTAHLAVGLTQGALRPLHQVLQAVPPGRAWSAGEITDVQTAAWLAMATRSIGNFDRGVAERAWPGAAIRHQLGGQLGIPHGEISAVVMPALFRHAVPASSPLARRVLAGFGARDLDELSEVLSDTARAHGLPTSLAEFGVDARLLAPIGERVAAESGGSWQADVVTRIVEKMLVPSPGSAPAK